MFAINMFIYFVIMDGIPFWITMLIMADILPFVWIAIVTFRKDHRGIHDLLAKTVVAGGIVN